jgi:aromatic ring-cleaving dioxygenase
MPEGKPTPIEEYHAHVYYDADTRSAAMSLREAIASRFDVRLGSFRTEPFGPHPTPSYQVAFGPELFASLVPWLMLNHGDLSVLIHPETGDALTDHDGHALWLGDKLAINFDYLRSRQA